MNVLQGNVVTISDLSFQDSNIACTSNIICSGFIFNDGTLTLVNSTVSGNRADLGAGIYNFSGTLTLINSTVSGNRANKGAGIYDYGTLTLINSTVSGNTASSDGGGIAFLNSQATLTFCTISDNVAHTGGGLFIANDQTQPSHVEVQNSIVAGNHADRGLDIAGTLTSGGYNLIQSTSYTTMTNESATSSNLVNVSPDIGPLQENGGPTKTHALLQGSPAIVKIPPNACDLKSISTDQRGVKRPQGAACDIGAYEYVPVH